MQSVFRRFGMASCKPAITPMVEKFYKGCGAEEDQSPANIELYAAVRPRPDILLPVLILARFQQKAICVLSSRPSACTQVLERDFQL